MNAYHVPPWLTTSPRPSPEEKTWKETSMGRSVLIRYTNWKGETDLRNIIPYTLWWGHTDWHPDDQWLLAAWDVEKEVWRDFALSGITSWSPFP